MKAMILAAGRGKRMRPLTDHTPKPLLKIAGKPLIVWHIENLKQAGFQDIVINIAWLGDQIPKALGDGSQFGVNLIYSDEQNEPNKGALETAGGIIKALPLLGDKPFLVVNGDVWCDYHYSNQNPLKGNDQAHLILVNNPDHNPKGDFALFNNRVDVDVDVEFKSKDQDQSKLTFSGIGYYHPELFKDLPEQKLALAPILRKAMHNNQVSGEMFSGEWHDIGTPERLKALDLLLCNS